MDRVLNPRHPPVPYRISGIPPCRLERNSLATVFNYCREDGSSPPLVIIFTDPSYFIETGPLDDFNNYVLVNGICHVCFLDRGRSGLNVYYSSLPVGCLIKLLECLSCHSYLFGEWELAPCLYMQII